MPLWLKNQPQKLHSHRFVKPAQVQSALRFHFRNLQLLFNFLQPYLQSFRQAFVVVIDNGFRDGRVAQVPLQGDEQVQKIAADVGVSDAAFLFTEQYQSAVSIRLFAAECDRTSGQHQVGIALTP